MKRFPDEFSKVLSARGRRVLAGKEKSCGALLEARFFSAGDLLDPAAVAAAPKILAKAITPHLVEMEKRAPAASQASVFTAQERLPKTVRVLTTVNGSEPTIAAAKECGLLPMLQSSSYKDFVTALAGRPLDGPVGMQVLCYRPGDYAGPHTDNHPEHPATRDGYVDAHLTFCSPGIDHQYLVYEREGHLSQVQPVTGSGSLTAYRLPFWHYVTPLVTRTAAARRWLVLGSFHFASTAQS